METTTISISIDAGLKRQVELVSASMGITSNDAFVVFACQFVAHRGFPFPVVEPVLTEREFAVCMDAAYLRMRNGEPIEHELLDDE